MSDDMEPTDEGKQTIVTERRETTFVVTINRPEVRNALDEPTAFSFAQALREFDRDEALAVAVLNGSGGTFCSGFDLKATALGTRMPHVREEGDGPLGVTRMLLSKPVIAAIEGYAVAGGLELALCVESQLDRTNGDDYYGRKNGSLEMPEKLNHKRQLPQERTTITGAKEPVLNGSPEQPDGPSLPQGRDKKAPRPYPE
jgi:hypothetical protein